MRSIHTRSSRAPERGVGHQPKRQETLGRGGPGTQLPSTPRRGAAFLHSPHPQSFLVDRPPTQPPSTVHFGGQATSTAPVHSPFWGRGCGRGPCSWLGVGWGSSALFFHTGRFAARARGERRDPPNRALASPLRERSVSLPGLSPTAHSQSPETPRVCRGRLPCGDMVDEGGAA